MYGFTGVVGSPNQCLLATPGLTNATYHVATIRVLPVISPYAFAIPIPAGAPPCKLLTVSRTVGDTNARNQQAFRDRVKREGGARVEVTLPKEVLDVVSATVQHMGVSRQDAVIHLINQGASTMQRNQYREDQLAGQPSRPSQMTLVEHQELERFKAQAATGIHMHEQDVKAHAFNGGDAGAARKEAFEAQLNASNIHRK